MIEKVMATNKFMKEYTWNKWYFLQSEKMVDPQQKCNKSNNFVLKRKEIFHPIKSWDQAMLLNAQQFKHHQEKILFMFHNSL
jgi:uncharacterized protein YehS (DUF1456 family)